MPIIYAKLIETGAGPKQISEILVRGLRRFFLSIDIYALGSFKTNYYNSLSISHFQTALKSRPHAPRSDPTNVQKVGIIRPRAESDSS
jgi:hypothetical protein